MMGFLYGSYTKEEENFSLSKKIKRKRIQSLNNSYDKVLQESAIVFNRTMRIQWKRTFY